MIWRPRPTYDELVEELGEELVQWGENIEALHDELPEDDGSIKPDDRAYPLARTGTSRVPVEQEVHDKYGNLMPCIICGGRLTVDGRYCRRHMD